MFENVFMLLLLILVPVLIMLMVMDIFLFKKKALKLAGSNLKNILPYYSEGQKWIKIVLYGLGLILVILALARPKWGLSLVDYKIKGRDILILLDVSNSMLTNDVLPSRFDLAKKNISELLDSESTDRIGLMIFSNECELISPMTNDYSAVSFFLDTLSPGIIGNGGTNIGNAILNSVNTFDDEEEMSSKMIVLITDGENLQGNLIGLLQKAQDRQIKIFTAGVGTVSGKPIPIKNNNGEIESFIKNNNGDIVVSKLDDKLLRLIAKETKGSYLGLIDGKNFLTQSVKKIKDVEKRDQGKITFQNKKERYDIFLLPALILFCIGFIMDQGKIFNIKSGDKIASFFNRSFLTIFFIFLFLIFSFHTYAKEKDIPKTKVIVGENNEQSAKFGKPNGGFWGNLQFSKGNYSKALEDYFAAINFLTKENLSKLYYNIGNAFYKINDLRRADKYFEDAKIFAKDEKLLSSIYYNQGLVAFKNQNFESAKNLFKKAIELNQQDDNARYNYVVANVLDHEAKKNDNENGTKKQPALNSQSVEEKSRLNRNDVNKVLNALDDKEKENNKKKTNPKNTKKGLMW